MDLKTIKNGKAQNSSPVSIIDKIFSIGNIEIKFFKRINDNLKERFFSEVGLLLNAGVDLQTVLNLSQTADGSNKLKSIYSVLYEKLLIGVSLSKAMEEVGQFNTFDTYSILIGESTGELSGVFNKLSAYYSKKNAQRRKTLNALSYPVIILVTTLLAVFFMLKFVVPMFASTLIQFGGELPELTKLIVAASEGIGPIALFTFITVALAVYWFRLNKDNVRVKKFVSNLVLRIPYIGNVIKTTYLLQFVQGMELLLSARIPLVDCLNLIKQMIDFYPLQIAIDKTKDDVVNGAYFYQSMAKHKLFDSPVITLIRIGEEVNQLDSIFLQLGNRYQADMEYKSNLLITILEPLMILFLAVIIGTILIALYLPMFKIGAIVN
jgi:type II secretory pathway component PulF